MPRLLVIQGVDEGRRFDLSGPQIAIGRDSSNALRLHDTEISRRHAELRLTPDGAGYRLLDRGSANGVFVNGKQIEQIVLNPGDQIQLGQTVLLYSADAKPDEITPRIRVISGSAAELAPAIVHSIDAAQGSRLLSQADEIQSPWLRSRLANLAILYEASQAISQILDVGQLLNRILELIFSSIEADRGCILLRESGGESMEPKAIRWRKKSGDDHLTVSRTITDYVLKHGAGILVTDAAHDDRFTAGQSILRTGIREAICVPMKGRHETLGVLYLDTLVPARLPTVAAAAPENRTTAKFTEDHLALAIALAHQAALAIEDTRYYQALMQAERLAAVGQTIAALSHHIKNILQGLRSGTEILGMGIRDKDDKLLHRGWRIVEKNQARIYDLVLDMLTYSKEREPAFEQVDVNAVVNEVVELFRPRAAEIGVALKFKPGQLPPTFADREGIHRAVLNLVANAMDAVSDRPNSKVSIATTQESDEWSLIAVKDNGDGIAPEQLPDLFKPFVSYKGSRGTGLGLAVSRKILREHGGDILVDSTTGRGSIFTIRLPIRGAPTGDATSVSPALPDSE